ncbi:MAG TPA: hypothetical protein VF576_03575 [Rubricoccaceae bacterium]
MTEAFRRRAGWDAARRLVAARAAREPAVASAVRRALVVLPAEEGALRAAWRFVAGLAVPVIPVIAGESLAFVPDAYAGLVVRLGRDALDWRGLPKRSLRGWLWTPDLDVAVMLGPPDDLAGAVLVGAAPVGLRLGVDNPDTPGFYDLALGAGTSDPPGELLARLAQIRPPLVPLRTGAGR